MKHRRIVFIILLSLLSFFNQIQAQSIIPQPKSISRSEGYFIWDTDMEVYIENKKMSGLKKYVSEALQLHNFVSSDPRQNNRQISKTKTAIRFVEERTSVAYPSNVEHHQADEEYELEVKPSEITVTATSYAGYFYALQTLQQLKEKGKLPCVTIYDEPRFEYRGFLLDCSRHFWTKDFIKKQLDAMAYFKLNRFHWHLVDAGGWRMEVKKYPRLTQETAYRTQSSWDKWWMDKDRHYAHKGDKGAYGGYYTQEDIKDVVRYAAERNIEVIPEIEMPGHSDEVCFAYPELACSKKPYTQSDLCVGNEDTYTFMENVLKEVMELFPSKYIHIGGDEADRIAWTTCPLCQQKMRENHLQNTAELQSYFTHRIEQFLNKHGRILMGWDEITEGKLAPNAAVMSWRGEKNGIEAAKNGHPVVMTPVNYCYIDMYQDAPMTQPKAQGGYIPLRKIYAYDPVPAMYKGTEVEKNILGLQACLWTENIETPEHVEYMAYPRLLALAEKGWSRNSGSYEDFRKRAVNVLERMKQKGYHVFDLAHEVGIRKEVSESSHHIALHKKVTYLAPYAEKYAADGAETLTDGKRGDWGYLEGRWQGFIKDGLDVVIDLGKEQKINTVKADFMQMDPTWVYVPNDIQLSVSSDNKQFTLLNQTDPQIPKHENYTIYTYQWKGKAVGRYLRLKAKTKIDGGWIFTDEVRVNE